MFSDFLMHSSLVLRICQYIRKHHNYHTHTHTAEEAIQEQLVQVKMELVQLDQKRQDPAQSNHHLRLADSQVSLDLH